MKELVLLGAAAAFLALGASTARADAGPWVFALNPGYAVPLGKASDIAKPDFMIEASGEYRFLPVLSAGLEAGYSSYKFAGTLLGYDFTSDARQTVWQATPFIRLSSRFEAVGAIWRPYALVGAGIYTGHNGGGTASINGMQLPVVESDWITHFGFNVGAGATVDLGERFELGLELRYHDIYTRQDINLSGSTNDVVQILVPSARLGYKF
jgi:outer membrane protein with beta-barrel domain